MRSILMVCRGNICRSPMAEGFFAHQLNRHFSQITVSSAGISALVHESADQHALEVMKAHGIDISQHRARQITDLQVRKADLILVMSKSHLRFLLQQFQTVKGKTFLLGHWQQCDIPDPFQQPREMFEKVYQQVELAWSDWQTRILSC